MKIVNRSDPLPAHVTRPAAVSHTPAYLALAAACFCIGMSAIFIKWAGVAGPVAAVYRVGVATLVLTLPFAGGRLRNAGPPLPRRAMALALLSGVFFAGDLGIWSEAVHFTSAANATLLGNLAPLWVALGIIAGDASAFWSEEDMADYQALLATKGGKMAAVPSLQKRPAWAQAMAQTLPGPTFDPNT